MGFLSCHNWTLIGVVVWDHSPVVELLANVLQVYLLITAEVIPGCVYLQGTGDGRPCGVFLPVCVPGELAGGKTLKGGNCLHPGLLWKS